jgi:hypothetical protein
MIPALPRPVATQLLIIRTALLAGLLLFGAATWYVQRNGIANAIAPAGERALVYVFIGAAVAALGGMFFLRSRLGATADVKQIVAMYIVGYAFAEGAALLSAVIWYVGGSRDWYIAGLVLMVVAFQILPVRRET